MNSEIDDVSSQQRFGFGKNWRNFLKVLDEDRIVEAECSLKSMLRVDDLRGKSVLDVGCGSGLFSLAAIRLGAAQVHSFDYDLQSVACTAEMKRRYFPTFQDWHIERGDVLERDYLANLCKWDIVYTWGVLHHTGNMWLALENVASLVIPGGLLFIAIYNDQGEISERWLRVKVRYNKGTVSKWLVLGQFLPKWVILPFILDILFFRRNPVRGVLSDIKHRRNILKGFVSSFRKPRHPLQRYRDYKKNRGMSLIHDWIDWLGGYPFEVAGPDELIEFYQTRGFSLRNSSLRTHGRGNNELVFQKDQFGV